MLKRMISLLLVFVLMTGMVPVEVFAQGDTGLEQTQSQEPPATEPPATEPPATEPPATEPPATEPPATEPPATEPPATEPPATEPPATEPPATEPPVTEPEETEPEETEPEETEPEETEPEETEPEETEPEETEPEETEPEEVPFAQSVDLGSGFAASMEAKAGVFPEGAAMHAQRNTGDAAQNVLKNNITALETALVFDLSVVDGDGNAIQPQGSVTVTLSVGDILSNLNGRIVSTYYVNCDAGTVSQLNAQTDSTVGTVTFVTDHFSTYAVAIRQAPVMAPPPKAPTLEEVVALYEALPEPDSISAKTTEEEKDAIFAQLEEAAAAYSKLGSDDMDTFDSEYFHLLIKEQDLNEALIADYSETLETGGLPIYIFLLAPNTTPSSTDTSIYDNFDESYYTQGSATTTAAAADESTVPHEGIRNVNNEALITCYIDESTLPGGSLGSFENFGTVNVKGKNYSSSEYDIVWVAISRKEGNSWLLPSVERCGCSYRKPHIHIDGQLSKRITPAAIKLTKTLPQAQDKDESFTFTMTRLQQASDSSPTEAQDTTFTPLTLSATVKAGQTSAPISGASGTFNFGYYKISETSSKKWYSDPVYLQVASDGTLKYSDKYNGGWATSSNVTVANKLQTYTVKYTDGLGGTVFADQGTTGLYYEAATPAFRGTPTREGYNFVGWSPAHSDKVLDDVTYVAQWELKTGSIQVEKTFAGITQKYLPTAFEITVASSDGTQQKLNFDNADTGSGPLTYTWTLSKMPIKDTYTVTESGYETVGHTLVPGSSTTSRYNVRVTENQKTKVQLRNVYEPIMYTITWLNDNGEQLGQDEVAHGETPSYDGQTPNSALLTGGSVRFAGWTPAIVPATEDTFYTATYDQTFTVTYKDFDDTVLLTENVPSGSTTPTCNPTASQGWVFQGWSPAVSQKVTADAVYTASWKVPYTVEHYRQAAGQYSSTPTVTESFTGYAGEDVTAQHHVHEGYVVDNEATGNLNQAILNKENHPVVLKLYYKQVFTVTWKDSFNQNTVFETDENVYYGIEASYGGVQPTRAQDGYYSYTFDGYWSTNANGTGDLYKQADNGTALYKVDVRKGENNSEVLRTEALTVTQNLTLYAQYTPHELHHTGTIEVLLNASYDTTNHVAVGGSPIDITAATQKAGIQNVVGLALFREGDTTNKPYDLVRTDTGKYQNDKLLDGIYHLHYKYGPNSYSEDPISTQQLDIQGKDRTRYLFFYSVNYDLDGGTAGPAEAYYRTGAAVTVSKTIPTKAGFVFSHWEEGTKKLNPSTDMASTVLTSSIGEAHTLKAVWIDAALIQVRVEMDHKHSDDGNSNNSKGELAITLTKGATELIGAVHKTTPTEGAQWGSSYTYLYENMPVKVSEINQYGAHVTLPGYKRIIETSTVTQVMNGDEPLRINGFPVYEIVAKLDYDPVGYDLTFTVTVDSDVRATNSKLVPKAVDVKVTRWDGDSWEPITRHQSSSVQVLIDDNSLSGTGTVHVAGYANDNKTDPYLYRIDVVGIDFDDSNYYMSMTDTNNDSVTYRSEEKGFFPVGAYTGTVSVTDGVMAVDSAQPGKEQLMGASATSRTLAAHITLHPYKVKLDPNGGKFSDESTDPITIEDRFTVPELAGYTPTQEGKTFAGWFVEDANGNLTSEQAGSTNYIIMDLLSDNTPLGSTLTLGAKWSNNITVTGQVAVSKYYESGDKKHYLNESDLLKTVTVLLQRKQPNGYTDTEKSETVTIAYKDGEAVGTGSFTFRSLPRNEEYRVAIISPNFDDIYQNEPKSINAPYQYDYENTQQEPSYTEDAFVAVVGTDNPDEAVVNIFMEFVPDDFKLKYTVNATAIAENFRPENVEIQVVYDDNIGHSSYRTWPAITQHNPNGQTLTHSGGIYNGYEQVWQKHTAGYYYDYAIKLHNYKLPGKNAVEFGNDAPFTVTYTNVPVKGDTYNAEKSPALTATLTPKEYAIHYDADGNGTLESMDSRKHKWSVATVIPEPEDTEEDGRVFMGWYENAQHTGNAVINIPAGHHAETNLYAWWEPDTNNDGKADIYQKTVTFKVENGAWNDGRTEDIIVAVDITDENGVSSQNGKGTLNAVNIPAAGSKPDSKFKASENPQQPWKPNFAGLTITEDTTFTYTYDPIHYDIIDPNGGWWTYKDTYYTKPVELEVGSYGAKADPLRTDYVFMGWHEEAVENDIHLKTKYTARWMLDIDHNFIADDFQKQVIFRVVNGTWPDGTASEISMFYELQKDGEPSREGSVDISKDIPDKTHITPAAGWLSDGAAWAPALPENGIVTGTDTETFVYSFTTADYRDVTYQPVDTNTDDDVTPDSLTDRIQSHKFIQVDPNGGHWRGSSNRQDLQLIENQTLEAPTRAQYVFIGWKKTVGGTPAGNEAQTIEFTYTAQWIHQNQLKYPVTVATWLDGVPTDIHDIHEGHSELLLKNSNGTGGYIPLTGSTTNPGTYTGKLLPGTYEVYFGEGHPVGDYLLGVVAHPGDDQNNLIIRHYSVNYYNDTPAQGTQPQHREIYRINSPVTVISQKPNKTGHEFLGWEVKDGDNTLYAPGTKLVSQITQKMDLVAQWSENIDVDVNITINHQTQSGNLDETEFKDDVTFTLMKVEGNVNRAVGETVTLSWNSLTNNYKVQKSPDGEDDNDVTETKYVPATGAHTFTNLSRGTYTVNVNKSHYTAVVTPGELNEETNIQTIDVVLTYDPDSYDLSYKVQMAAGIPEARYPKAVNIRVQYLKNGIWQDIAQHEGSAAPNQVTLTNGLGTGTHSVWKHIDDPNKTVEYTIRVSSFVYSDGTTVRAEFDSATGAYTDGNFSATVAVDGLATDHKGAYFGTYAQIGIPTATVTVETYDITFDANKGSTPTKTLKDQYAVPGSLEAYKPIRENFSFLGWYVGSKAADGTVTVTNEKVVPGKILTGDLYLVAKWAPIRSVYGTIQVAGSYQVDGKEVSVHSLDRAQEATVYLQRVQTNTQPGTDASQAVTIASAKVPVTWNGTLGTAQYQFPELAAGYDYQIWVDIINYTATYENEDPSATGYRLNGNKAIYQDDEDISAVVNAKLGFAPDSYTQTCVVDATQIGTGFRPETAHVVIEGLKGNETNYVPIAQHSVSPYGLAIELETSGETYQGSETEEIWNYHWNNLVYRYRMEVTEVDDKPPMASDPYTIVYGEDQMFDGVDQSGNLIATLVPKKFDVVFDYEVPGKQDYVASNGHTWSHETEISAIAPPDPARVNQVFMGWVDASGNPVTKITAATAQNTTVYAKWSQDILSTDPTKPSDGIPDEYQCVITYKILGGTWGQNAGSLDKQQVFSLKVKNDEGIWEDRTPTLGQTIPQGMTQNGATVSDNGTWKPYVSGNQQINQNTPVTGDATYTYVFGTSVTVIVENGTAWFGDTGGHSVTNGTHTHLLGDTSSEDTSTVIRFAPQSGYLFKSSEVYHNGEAAENQNLTNGTYTVQNDMNTMIHVVYGPDVNGDKVLDEYQKVVTYRIENGTWDGSDMDDIVEYVTLLDGNTPSASGSGTLRSVPDLTNVAPISGQYKGGAWVTPLPDNNIVTGLDPVTFTFRYVPRQYVTYTYDVEHYTENLDGTFTLMAEDTQKGSLTIELNLAGNGYEQGASGTIVPTRRTYPHFLFNEIDSAHAHPLQFGMAEHHVLKMYYNRDQHDLIYDLADGAAPADKGEQYYASERQICSTEVTLRDAPVREGYDFTGWKLSFVDSDASAVSDDTATDDISIFQPGGKFPLIDDIKATAQWKINHYPYIVEYYYDGVKNDAQTGSFTAEFHKNMSVANGTEEGVAKVVTIGTDVTHKIAKAAKLGENNYVLQEVTLSGDKIAVEGNVIKVNYVLDNWGEDGKPDAEQILVHVVVNPNNAGSIEGAVRQVLTPENGQAELDDIAVVPVTGWRLRNWTIQEQANPAARAVSATQTLGTGTALTDQRIAVEPGKTYIISANMDRLTTPVVPAAAAYLVEHYQKDAVTGSYVLKDTDIRTGALDTEVQAEPKVYAGFTLNHQAVGYTSKGTVTLPRTENGEIVNMLKLKLYYDPDTGGDGVPDMYQKTVIFSIVNGHWYNGTSENITVTLTLTDASGNWNSTGSAYLKPYVPENMRANWGYHKGKWDTTPPDYVSGTDTAVYTYRYVAKNLMNPRTGDDSTITAWLMAMLAALASLVYMFLGYHRKKKVYSR